MDKRMNRVVVVTGCGSGIGEYIANKYIESGYEVIGIDINDVKEDKGFKFIKLDLRNEEETEAAFQDIKVIDLAINCAGVSSLRKPLIEFSSKELMKGIEDNVLPCFNALKNELIIMKKQQQGKIINMASITGYIGMKNFAAYSAAKAGIINITKVAALEHSKDNIRVNSISPATIDTPMIRKKYNGSLKDYSNVYYTKGCGTTNDVYTVVKMLEENNFITGSDIKLDGGLTSLFTI
ncbi:hypothetical protein ABFX02_O011500 [Erythranthe guttata]